jgi:hypothetical protein
MLRLVAKWLNVGILEDGRRTRGVCGAPQGARRLPCQHPFMRAVDASPERLIKNSLDGDYGIYRDGPLRRVISVRHGLLIYPTREAPWRQSHAAIQRQP